MRVGLENADPVARALVAHRSHDDGSAGVGDVNPRSSSDVGSCLISARLIGPEDFGGAWVTPGAESRDMEFWCAAIGELGAVRRRDDAARCTKHGVAGGHIPFAGLGETRVEVRAALGDTGEFKGGAARRPCDDREPLQEYFGLRVEVRAAQHGSKAFEGWAPGVDGGPFRSLMRRGSGGEAQSLRAMPDDAAKRGLERGLR
jgi:hypothetical protein